MIVAGTINGYGDFEADPEQLPCQGPALARMLPQALQEWRAAACRLVWLKVPAAKAALIPVAVEHGFEFHHSQADYLMLICILEAGTFVPYYATHYIGAGGVVVDPDGNLLVVSERYRRNRNRPHWKLPGGALHPGEHLAEGVVREVREETGVETEFSHLAAFRHWHGYRFGQSDIYMVCRLTPLSHTITKCDQEIDHCMWMPLAEYLASEDVGHFNRTIVQAAVSHAPLAVQDLPAWIQPSVNEFLFHPDCSLL